MRAGASYALDRPLVFGSGAVDVQIADDPTVSGRHARFIAHRGKVTVTDLGSNNGTFVNGRRITGGAEIGDGDLIRLGATQVKVRVEKR